MATAQTLHVLSPADTPDEHGVTAGLTYGSTAASLSLGFDVIDTSRPRPGQVPANHVSVLADTDDPRRLFRYRDDGDTLDAGDDGAGYQPLDLSAVVKLLGRHTRAPHSDRLRAAHRYLRAVRDEAANHDDLGGLGGAVVVLENR